MLSLDKLKRQLSTTSDLKTVVSTMKTLSAVNIRQYEAAVTSLQEYAQTVAQGLQVVLQEHLNELKLERLSQAPTTALVFGSDTGLCGRFNESIVSYALADLDALSPTGHYSVIAVGSRVALELAVRDKKVNRVLNLPSSITGVTTVAQSLLVTIDTWGKQHDQQRMLLYYNRPEGHTGFKARKLQIYPLDLAWLKRLADSSWNSRSQPIYSMNGQDLFSALIREYYFVSLYRTLAESLSSENAARLAAMQAAEQNIEEQLNDLTLELNLLRQTNITEELLDIVAGAEVLATNG